MSIKSFLRKIVKYDTLVYWPPTTVDDSGIMQVSTTPQQIDCRWDDKQVDYLDKKGATQVSSAVIMTEVPLSFGGIVWHGKLTNVTSVANATANLGAREIRGTKNIGDLKNKVRVYTTYL